MVTDDEHYNKICEKLAYIYTDWETDRPRRDSKIRFLINSTHVSVVNPFMRYSLAPDNIFECYILREYSVPVIKIMINMVDTVYAPAIPDSSSKEKGIMFKAIVNRVIKVLFSREITDVKIYDAKSVLKDPILTTLRRIALRRENVH